MIETKTLKGRGSKFLQWSIDSHQKAGWEVLTIERGTLGSITVVYTRTVEQATTPPRPDVHA